MTILIAMDFAGDAPGAWEKFPEATGTLETYRDANLEDDETLEALECLVAGADVVILGGGAAPLVRLRPATAEEAALYMARFATSVAAAA